MELVERLRYLGDSTKVIADGGDTFCYPAKALEGIAATCTEAADLLEETLKALKDAREEIIAWREVGKELGSAPTNPTPLYIDAILTKSQGEKIDG